MLATLSSERKNEQDGVVVAVAVKTGHDTETSVFWKETCSSDHKALDERGFVSTFFFLYLHETCCGYSLEMPLRDASNEYPQHVFMTE